MSSVKERVERVIDYLPPIPIVLHELLAGLEDDTLDLRSLANIISKDPSMSMNLLKLANSAFYGLPNRVSTIADAVRMLGTREITLLCVSLGTSAALNPKKGEATLDLDLFWQHSVATGVIAKALCRKFDFHGQTDLYMGGLVHDVGVVILDRVIHETYKEVLALTATENIALVDAETRLLGENHGKVGSWLMEKWRLPPLYGAIAEYHHALSGAREGYRVPVSVISLADELTRGQSLGFGGDMSGVVISDTDAFKNLERVDPKLADADLVKFIWDLDESIDEITEIKDIMIGQASRK